MSFGPPPNSIHSVNILTHSDVFLVLLFHVSWCKRGLIEHICRRPATSGTSVQQSISKVLTYFIHGNMEELEFVIFREVNDVG